MQFIWTSKLLKEGQDPRKEDTLGNVAQKEAIVKDLKEGYKQTRVWNSLTNIVFRCIIYRDLTYMEIKLVKILYFWIALNWYKMVNTEKANVLSKQNDIVHV